jgi:hypothetical protein
MWRYLVAPRGAALIYWLGRSAAALAAVVLFGGVLAQADGQQAKPTAAEVAAAVGTTTWGGLGWGIGVAADFDIGGDRVVDAQLVNGIVRVTDTTSNVNLGFVLEAHYFLREFYLPISGSTGPMKIARDCTSNYPGAIYLCGGTEIGWGPFVAIEVANGTKSKPSEDSTITAFALGLMIGFHHVPPAFTLVSGKVTPTNDTKSDTRSWNFGVGLRVDPVAKILGEGIIANQSLPSGETAIRFKKEPRAGIILISSFSF